MSMRLKHFGLGMAVLLTTGCPQGERVLGNGGFGIGSSGTPATDALSFTVQPSSAIATQIITPAIQVTVLDSLGNTDPNFTAAVTIAIRTNPVGGNLSGTTRDRKSTRLNSSHLVISYAVFCLKKKKKC